MANRREWQIAVYALALWTLNLALAGQGAWAKATDAPGPWLTDSALELRLAEPIGVDWAGRPLRQALAGLAESKRVAVLLDRRVDPDQELAMSLKDVPLGEVFRQLAETQHLGMCRFGPVVYFGPPRYTSQLRTLATMRLEDVRKLRGEVGLRLLRRQRLAWDDFAEPRKLLDSLAEDNGFEIVGLEQIPHDLWAAADLPPLMLVDRLTLVAGQYDLTFRIDTAGKKLTLVPLPETISLVRSYAAGRHPEELLEKWAAIAPGCRIERAGSRIVVEGLLEDHERIAGINRPASRTAAATSKPAPDDSLANKRFTVREGNGPLNGILEELGRRLNLQMKIDREALDRAGVSLTANVTFNVEDATLDQLLDAVLKPAGCTFRRQGATVEILPAK